MVRLLPIASAVAAALLATAASAAPTEGASHRGRDHDAAIVALQRGEILPLAAILAAARRHTPGEVIDVELERDGGAFIYEIRVLTPNGRVQRVHLNARTGEPLRAGNRN